MAGKRKWFSRQGSSSQDEAEEDIYISDDAMRPIREVAMKLGIGRTRVVQVEQAALARARSLLAKAGINSLDDLGHSSVELASGNAQGVSRGAEKGSGKLYQARHGWLRVRTIHSLNGGSEAVRDIVTAYQILKRLHEQQVRPPLLVSLSNGVATLSRIEAVAESEQHLHLRCWPRKSGKYSIQGLEGAPCTAIVESEFGHDRDGDFDIPILMCAIVSARTA
jgi:hypothetical protein